MFTKCSPICDALLSKSLCITIQMIYFRFDSVVCGTSPWTLKKLMLLSRFGFVFGLGELGLLLLVGDVGGNFALLGWFAVFVDFALLLLGCM